MRALLVYKKSTYQLYAVERNNPHVQTLLERGDPSVRSLRPGHEKHTASIEDVYGALRRAGYRVNRTYRARIPDVDAFDLVVTVGGDGTLLDLSHHIATPHPPLLGVNSDPKRSVGLLAGATPANLPEVLEEIRWGQLRPTAVTRLRLELDGEPLPLLALNDILVTHRNPASTSRYRLRLGSQEEAQKSSGIWVASAVGSTAALRSAGGELQPIEDSRLQFRVREAYGGNGRARLTAGYVPHRRTLSLTSAMRDGRIYVDGPHVTYRFVLGAKLRVSPVPRSLALYLRSENLLRRQQLSSPSPGRE